MLVTGGSKGIGRAICVEMAKSGYQVIVNYLSDAAGARETLALVEQQGGRGICLPFDVSDDAATQLAMEKIFATYASLDVLVNNAGRIADELFIMMTPDKWRSVIDVTLQGFYNVTRPVLEKMVVQEGAPWSRLHRWPASWATAARPTTRRPRPV